jgi:NitT/TauT family transport system ATP-binding protein
MRMIQTAEWRRKQSGQDMPAQGPVLDLRSVSVRYLTKSGLNTAVTDVSVKVDPGEFVSIVGPSGCGKSTLLHVAAGLIRPAAGKVTYLGQEWTGLHPDVGYVTQKDTLLPWKNVIDNIALPLKLKGMGKAERRTVAAEMAENLGLADYLKHFPAQLSGGMRQRVQLGRTLVTRPKLLLMDEPFGALDVMTRERMGFELMRLCGIGEYTVLFVTHSISEAVLLSDAIVIMRGRGDAAKPHTLAIDLPRPRTLATMRDRRFVELAAAVREEFELGRGT